MRAVVWQPSEDMRRAWDLVRQQGHEAARRTPANVPPATGARASKQGREHGNASD